MPKLSDFHPLSNHELITQINNRSASTSLDSSALELSLLKVELALRAKPAKTPSSQASKASEIRNLVGDDLKNYEVNINLRLNEADTKVLAAHMDQLSFKDRVKVNEALSLTLGYEEARDLLAKHKPNNWKLNAKYQIQNLLIFAVIIAAILLYKWSKGEL